MGAGAKANCKIDYRRVTIDYRTWDLIVDSHLVWRIASRAPWHSRRRRQAVAKLKIMPSFVKHSLTSARRRRREGDSNP